MQYDGHSEVGDIQVVVRIPHASLAALGIDQSYSQNVLVPVVTSGSTYRRFSFTENLSCDPLID